MIETFISQYKPQNYGWPKAAQIEVLTDLFSLFPDRILELNTKLRRRLLQEENIVQEKNFNELTLIY